MPTTRVRSLSLPVGRSPRSGTACQAGRADEDRSSPRGAAPLWRGASLAWASALRCRSGAKTRDDRGRRPTHRPGGPPRPVTCRPLAPTTSLLSVEPGLIELCISRAILDETDRYYRVMGKTGDPFPLTRARGMQPPRAPQTLRSPCGAPAADG